MCGPGGEDVFARAPGVFGEDILPPRAAHVPIKSTTKLSEIQMCIRDRAIIVDNETQFDAKMFKDFCDQIGTKIHFASVRHP